MFVIFMHAVIYFRFELELRCHVEGILHTVRVNLQLQKMITAAKTHVICKIFPFIVIIFVVYSIITLLTKDRLDVHSTTVCILYIYITIVLLSMQLLGIGTWCRAAVLPKTT